MEQKAEDRIWLEHLVSSRGFEFFFVYLLGAAGYGLLEIAWRGFTHWTMLLTGGVCFLAIYWMNLNWPSMPILKKCFWGMLVITSMELLVGILVNRVLHWNVWDYSAMHFNFLGQISLVYSTIWFLLGIPLHYLSGWLHKYWNRRQPQKRTV